MLTIEMMNEARLMSDAELADELARLIHEPPEIMLCDMALWIAVVGATARKRPAIAWIAETDEWQALADAAHEAGVQDGLTSSG